MQKLIFQMTQQDRLLASAVGSFRELCNAFREIDDFFFLFGWAWSLPGWEYVPSGVLLLPLIGQNSQHIQCLLKEAWMSWIVCSLSSQSRLHSSFYMNHEKKTKKQISEKTHHLHIFLSFKVTGCLKYAETSEKSLQTLLPRRRKLIRLESNLKTFFSFCPSKTAHLKVIYANSTISGLVFWAGCTRRAGKSFIIQRTIDWGACCHFTTERTAIIVAPMIESLVIVVCCPVMHYNRSAFICNF